MPTLYVLQGPDKGRTLRSDDDDIIIGRGSNQVPLTDQTVSRRHAQLKADSGVWTLCDLNSANGTYLNGVRVTKGMRLKHGDQIRVGGSLLVYGGDDSVEQVSGANIPRDLVTLDAGSVEIDASVVASIPSNEDSVVLAAPETAYAVRSWKAIRELTDVIGSLVSTDQLLPRVLDIVFEQAPVDRGILFLHDDETGVMIPEVVRFKSRKARAEAQRNAVTASRTIMEHVSKTREGVLCTNVINDERFRSGKSIHDLGMRSVICAPIIARERVMGLIYLDVPISQHTYNEHELKLFTAIAYQTGLALENARLVKAMVERERLAAAGETVAYLSHSIKNILQGMRAGADVVQKGIDQKDFTTLGKGWGILDRNLDKCYALMLNMLAFSKQREPQLDMLMVNKIIEATVELAQAQADDAGIMLLSDLDETIPPIPVDEDGLHQSLLNLLTNAIDAAPRGGTGRINVRTWIDSAERRVVISVTDNGPGVAPEMRDKLFDPFQSTKGHGGTGLGLPVSRKMVHEMGGSIQYNPASGGGAEFRILLPTSDARKVSPGDTQGPRG